MPVSFSIDVCPNVISPRKWHFPHVTKVLKLSNHDTQVADTGLTELYWSFSNHLVQLLCKKDMVKPPKYKSDWRNLIDFLQNQTGLLWAESNFPYDTNAIICQGILQHAQAPLHVILRNFNCNERNKITINNSNRKLIEHKIKRTIICGWIRLPASK